MLAICSKDRFKPSSNILKKIFTVRYKNDELATSGCESNFLIAKIIVIKIG